MGENRRVSVSKGGDTIAQVCVHCIEWGQRCVCVQVHVGEIDFGGYKEVCASGGGGATPVLGGKKVCELVRLRVAAKKACW